MYVLCSNNSIVCAHEQNAPFVRHCFNYSLSAWNIQVVCYFFLLFFVWSRSTAINNAVAGGAVFGINIVCVAFLLFSYQWESFLPTNTCNNIVMPLYWEEWRPELTTVKRMLRFFSDCCSPSFFQKHHIIRTGPQIGEFNKNIRWYLNEIIFETPELK